MLFHPKPLSLVTHIYNEEFLLPYWLKHHVPMFDYGVVIDYDSTDRSLDIVRDLAPHWDIRRSRNSYFEEPYISNEVMTVERELDGWKMALNTTEFLLMHDLRSYCYNLDANDIKHIRTSGVVMVDRPRERQVVTEEPLVLQKTFGFFEKELLDEKQWQRSRLLHCHDDGDYIPGRHLNQHTDAVDEKLFLCWFGFAPFHHIIGRRVRKQVKFPWKKWHQKGVSAVYQTVEMLEDLYTQKLKMGRYLLDNVNYCMAYDDYKANYEISTKGTYRR